MIPGWKEEIGSDYLQILRQEGRATPAGVAARLGVTEGWAVYWLTALAREGKARIVGVELAGQGETLLKGQPSQRSQLRAVPQEADSVLVLQEAA